MKKFGILLSASLLALVSCGGGSNDPYGKTFRYESYHSDYDTATYNFDSGTETVRTVLANNINNINWDASLTTVPEASRGSAEAVKSYLDGIESTTSIATKYGNYRFAFGDEASKSVKFTNGDQSADYVLDHQEGYADWTMKTSDGESVFALEPWNWYNGSCSKAYLEIYENVLIGVVTYKAGQSYTFLLKESYKGLQKFQISYYANFVC